MRSIGGVAVLIAALLVACGTPPTPSVAVGSGGFVTVTVVMDPGQAEPFFETVHRARLVAADGALAAEWEVTEASPPSPELAPDTYRLDVFTIFLSDSIQCVEDPVAAGGERCWQPTMGPHQVCSVSVVVVARQQTQATFRPRREGLCVLEGAEPAAI